MAAEDRVKRWRSTRKGKGFRESLGIPVNRRSESKEKVEPGDVPKGCMESMFNDYDSQSSASSSDRKIAKVRDMLFESGSGSFKDSDIKYALNSQYANGDPDLAFVLLDMIETSDAGQVTPYNPDVKIQGAENYRGVTCYLDATLFAMFARLDDFQAMLYHTSPDPAVRRLVVLLRLWVNLLRKGHLITTDITAQIGHALAACGWPEAALKQQQDASECFNFITDKLDLPRLTLKKDMFHQGKADQDDHKFTNERTIDVGIPQPQDGKTVTLEDCLMEYFDERVMVDRQQYAARRNTVGSSPAPSAKRSDYDPEKPNKALHVEFSEVTGSNPGTPTEPLPAYDGRPQLMQVGRTASIFEDKKTDPEDDRALSPSRKNSLPTPATRRRATTTGKAVKMPAFQFFRLIPWYTEGNPNSDLQVAQHFETKRPTVGICLKRFGQNNDGTFYKRTDKIDIPLETGIPEFLHDDDFGDERFPNHKFKLSLQSLICHRGTSIQNGHYISFVRADQPSGLAPMDDSAYPLGLNKGQDPWLCFDDLATTRVRYVDIKAELDKECPYVLFYKIVLRDDEDQPGRVSMDGRPPSYTSDGAESNSNTVASTNFTDPESVPAAELKQVKSGTSSVISATSGPPVAPPDPPPAIDTVATPVPVHAAPMIVEPRSGSIAIAEGGAIRPLEQATAHPRAQSGPPEATALPVVTQTEIDTPDGLTHQPVQSAPNVTATGSLSRGLGSLFKPRASSKGRGSTMMDSTGTEHRYVSAPTTPGTDDPSAIPLTGNAIENPSSHNGSVEAKGASSPGTAPRKSIDFGTAFSRKGRDGARASRKKDKSSHRRERSLHDRLKSHGDKTDRECNLM